MTPEQKANIRESINDFLKRDREAVEELQTLWYLGEREQEKARIHFISERLKDACSLLVIIGNELAKE